VAASNQEADWRAYYGPLYPDPPWPWIGRSGPSRIILRGAPVYSTLIGSWTIATGWGYAVAFGPPVEAPFAIVDGEPVTGRLYGCRYDSGSFAPTVSLLFWFRSKDSLRLIRFVKNEQLYGHWHASWLGPQLWGQSPSFSVVSEPMPPDTSGLIDQTYSSSLQDFLPSLLPAVPLRHSRVLLDSPPPSDTQVTSIEYTPQLLDALDFAPDNAAPPFAWWPDNYANPNPPPPA